MELHIPPDVATVVERLHHAQHEAYVVGGCVRDALRGIEPADWDVATDARPEQIQKIFRRSLYTNRFGTVVVRMGGREIEVTTYRIETEYSDHRRPDAVAFTDSLQEDLARRDFTMNAMAWSPERGVVDPFGGQRDLEARLVRAVGDPDERFAEDALRMLRAVRFAAVLGFTIEPATADAIRRNAELARSLSGERIQQELAKIVRGPVPSVGLRMLSNLGLLAVVAPELERCRETPQEKVAAQDVFEHSLATLDAAAAEMPAATPPEEDLVLRLAALFHDVGKPDTFDDGHFHQHEFVGEAKVRQILRRWRFDKATVDAVSHLVRNHMFWYQPDWTSSAVRRFIRKVGLEQIPTLFALRKADNVGSGARAPRMYALNELWLRVQEEIQRANAFSKKDLAVDGNDVKDALAIPQGPEVGRVLDELFERVLDDPDVNTRERLLEMARAIHARGPGEPRRS
ncbi:MAG: HD domain-containing protein [Chloroflexota bacterium]|nr:HD domain-containing protein [Chloroflexota bacterium]MDE3101381.1 HD domain-containing protein [Chloroflexota bacterium]